MTADNDLKLEIPSAIVKLAYLADYGTVADYLACLCDDALWTISRGGAAQQVQNRAEIEAGVRQRRGEGRQGPGSAVRHVVNNVAVQINLDGSVSAVSYYSLYRGTDSEPRLASMGRYFDTWRLEAGRWRIARREVFTG